MLAIFVSFSSVSNCGCASFLAIGSAAMRRQLQESLQRGLAALHDRVEQPARDVGRQPDRRGDAIDHRACVGDPRQWPWPAPARMSPSTTARLSSVGTNDAAALNCWRTR